MEIQIKNTFSTYTVTEGKEKRREWRRTFRILKNHLYLTISNCRVKKRSACGYSRQGKLAENMRDIKGRMYKKQQGRCPHCGGVQSKHDGTSPRTAVGAIPRAEGFEQEHAPAVSQLSQRDTLQPFPQHQADGAESSRVWY